MIAFVNGSWFDGHRYRGALRGALVIDGAHIIAVDTAPPTEAEVVDLERGLISPGFIDAHVHAVQGGLEQNRCDLSATTTAETSLTTIASYALAHPAGWVLGGGWAMSAFPGGTPSTALLDEVLPDRPAFLLNRDHHGAWVNSTALRLANITKTTPDPVHGRIERDAEGNPTGTLHEGAMDLVQALVPPTTADEMYAGLMTGQAYLHSVGVTGWQDAIVGAYGGIDDPGPTYAEAARRGDLTAWVVGALWWERDRGLEQLPGLIRRRNSLSGGRFRATSVKVMQDGVAENFTAAVSAPYLDRCGHNTSNHGHSFVDPTALRSAAAELDAAGFQIHVHAIGDRAVRESLDALADLGPERRHHLAHLQLIDPSDIPRFAASHVAANCQALWACLDDQMAELTIPFLGAERAGWQYPFGSLHKAGARLVMGSDWPVSSPDPLAALHVAVNRWPFGSAAEPFLAHQSLALETAFAAYTSGSAWINHRADAGELKAGFAADLVTLDRDPFLTAPEEIGATSVTSTWVEGQAVYRR